MVFKAAFLIQAPDSDPWKDRATVKTPRIEATIIATGLGDIDLATAVAKDLVENKGVHEIDLCPGFGHEAVARIKEAVKGKASIAISRPDSEGLKFAVKILTEEKYFPNPEDWF